MVDLCAENENWTKPKLHWSMISVGTCTKERKIRRLVKLQKGDAHEKSEVERFRLKNSLKRIFGLVWHQTTLYES